MVRGHMLYGFARNQSYSIQGPSIEKHQAETGIIVFQEGLDDLPAYDPRGSPAFRAGQVIDRLADLFIGRELPENIRSENEPEFTARAI